MKIIMILGLSTGEMFPLPMYLTASDVDAQGGLGAFTATNDFSDARCFSSAERAIAYLMQASSKRPLREDGEPNRPLMGLMTVVMDEP